MQYHLKNVIKLRLIKIKIAINKINRDKLNITANIKQIVKIYNT